MSIDDNNGSEPTLEEILASASHQWEDVELMLDGDLRSRYEKVKARIDARAAARAAADESATHADVDRVQAGDDRLSTKLGALEDTTDEADRDHEQDVADLLLAEMRKKRFKARLKSMPRPKYNELVEKHPPRRGDDGMPIIADYSGVNTSTFYEPLVRACLVKPVITTDEQWALFLEALNDKQFDKLAHAAARINRRDEDIPK